MKQYQAVFFDLDGTLMDTSMGVIQAIDYIIETYRLPGLSEQEKRAFIGPPIQESFQVYCGCSKEQAWELATAWRDAYKEKFLLEAMPYDGIYDLLRCLRQKGIKTCVATNKREDYTRKLLRHFSFLPLFDCIIGSDFEGKRSKPDMIRLCMEQTEMTDSERCLMVGDTAGDAAAAQKASVDFLGVTYGFGFTAGTTNLEANAVMIADSCAQIQEWLI